MIHGILRAVMMVTLVAALGDVFVSPADALTANWPIPITAASSGLAHAGNAPAVPTGVTSACTSLSGSSVTVTWTLSAHATGYTILESTTSATGTYTAVASGVASSPWTSGSLALGSYWFEVVATIGANWVSVPSAATAQRTVVNVLLAAVCA